MKRLVATLMLILCLSFPVLAGHVMGDRYCECDNPGSHNTLNMSAENEKDTQDSASEIELGLILFILLFLKAKA